MIQTPDMPFGHTRNQYLASLSGLTIIFETVNFIPHSVFCLLGVSGSEFTSVWLRLWHRMVFASSSATFVIRHPIEFRTIDYWTIVMVWLQCVARCRDGQPSFWILCNKTWNKAIIAHISHSSSGIHVNHSKDSRRLSEQIVILFAVIVATVDFWLDCWLHNCFTIFFWFSWRWGPNVHSTLLCRNRQRQYSR